MPDTVGNLVRILDFVPGQSLYEFLRRIDMPHREYYRNLFPGIIQSVIGCIEGIAQLHLQGLQHGDIRADHILLHNHGHPHLRSAVPIPQKLGATFRPPPRMGEV